MYGYAKEIDSRRKLKMKKKVLSVVLAAMCVVSMAACGSSNKSSDSSEGESKDKLVMATNAEFPPYEFYEGDEIVGIDAEFAKAIADKLGAELCIKWAAGRNNRSGKTNRGGIYPTYRKSGRTI